MNGEEIPIREIEALADIKKIDKISNHQTSLLDIFNNDGIELVQFILILLTNNLLIRTERYMLLTIFLKLSEAYGLNLYFKLIWEIERDMKGGVVLLYDLVISKSYTKVG